jgi:predicted lipoprotein with Yx(FWY)xxD motif
MRTLPLLLVLAALAVAGCGDDDSGDTDTSGGSAANKAGNTAANEEAAGAKKEDAAPETSGATITLRDSNFGPMLFDSNKQAIYVFERDSRNKTVCYGECARAWPPVLTKGRPVAGKGVDAGLLGTVRRRSGRRQVTYAGQPLYFYAHEQPGEVKCHNVDLNGGFWWVVGPDGKRRA